MPVETEQEGEVIGKYHWCLMLGIEDPYGKAIDTCLPDQTGLHCCLVGPGYYGFCSALDLCL